jgi:hypothetical protein
VNETAWIFKSRVQVSLEFKNIDPGLFLPKPLLKFLAHREAFQNPIVYFWLQPVFMQNSFRIAVFSFFCHAVTRPGYVRQSLLLFIVNPIVLPKIRFLRVDCNLAMVRFLLEPVPKPAQDQAKHCAGGVAGVENPRRGG